MADQRIIATYHVSGEASRIEDRAFADHVRGYIDGGIAQSVEITRENYRSATGLVQRAKQFVAYLLMAVADPAVSRGLNWGIDDET